MLLFYTTYMNYPGKPDSAADIVEEENSLLRNKTHQLQKMLKPLLDKVHTAHTGFSEPVNLQQWFKTLPQEEYKERLERVKRTCDKYGLRPEDKTRKFKALQKRASPSPERNVFCCHLKNIRNMIQESHAPETLLLALLLGSQGCLHLLEQNLPKAGWEESPR